ncbi:hypothetical protein FQN57_005128 [Myotisia sp. PD_48]|nr:hypothetical protein FQN57_005128 [Myotisia sp. PD_48]
MESSVPHVHPLTPPPPPLPPAPSTSVFASLHRRARTLDSISSPTLIKPVEARTAAAREVKKHLLSVIRDDWAFSSPDKLATESSTNLHSPEPVPELKPDQSHTILEWKLRDQDTSSDLDEERDASKTSPNPYRFESPDAVEQTLRDRRIKRRKVIENETQWNEGLRIWMQRRDAWTGAKLPTPAPPPAQVRGPKPNPALFRQSTSSDESYIGSCGTEPPDTSSQHSLSRTASCSSAAPHKPSTETDNSIDTVLEGPFVDNASGDLEEPFIPVMSPLIPDSNPLRASISPAVYSTLYNRLVVQSNTPAVPINLSHMVRALVQGWKADGEWPPKPTFAQHVPVVKRLAVNKPNPNEPVDSTTKSKRRSGVSNAVKKVLGLSSFHPGNRIHIRSGSQSRSTPQAADDNEH